MIPGTASPPFNLNVDHVEDQIAGSALFRLAGLPAADAKPVRMFSNGVNLFDDRFYAHVETLNGDFAENHFTLDDGGNLYKGRRPNESPPKAGFAHFDTGADVVAINTGMN